MCQKLNFAYCPLPILYYSLFASSFLFVNMLPRVAGDTGTIAVVAPLAGAIGIIFAFPDGHFVFDLINYIPVGLVSFLAVWRCRNHHYGTLTNGYFSNPVLCHSQGQLPAPG